MYYRDATLVGYDRKAKKAKTPQKFGLVGHSASGYSH